MALLLFRATESTNSSEAPGEQVLGDFATLGAKPGDPHLGLSALLGLLDFPTTRYNASKHTPKKYAVGPLPWDVTQADTGMIGGSGTVSKGLLGFPDR